jgi:hypothetical protein
MSEDRDQIRNGEASAAGGGELSALADSDGSLLPATAANRTDRRAPIRTKSRDVRRTVSKLRDQYPWISDASLDTLVRREEMAKVMRKQIELFERLGFGALVRKDGNPAAFLDKLNPLAQTLLKYDEALLLTPAAQAQHGLSLVKLREATTDEPTADNRMELERLERRWLAQEKEE